MRKLLLMFLVAQFHSYGGDARLTYDTIEIKHAADLERAVQFLCPPGTDPKVCFVQGTAWERRWLMTNAGMIQTAIQTSEGVGAEYGVKP